MSGGIWTEADTSSVDTEPGIYINLITEARRQLDPGTGVVFVVGTANWGAMDEVTLISSEQALYDMFTTGGSLPRLATQALRGGAALVRCLRIGGSAADEASGNFVDTADTPANVMTATATHEGTRGNGLTVGIAAATGGGLTIEITEGGGVVEAVSATSTDVDVVVAAINANSALITAVRDGATGREVGVQSVTLAGGDSGETLASGDFTAAQGIAQSYEFDTYVQDDDTTTANQDAASDWADLQRNEGNRFLVVMGGPSTETITEAITRAQALDSMSTVYVHPGFVDTDGVTYSGQDAAARIAGMIAAAGFTRAITWGMIGDARRPNSVLTSAATRLGLAAGVTLITSSRAGVRLSRGLVTLTSTGATGQPSNAFRKIRTVATADAIAEGLERGITPFIGSITNDEDGRRGLAAAALAFLEQLVSAGAIQEAPGVEVSTGAADQVFLRVRVGLLDSIEEVFVTVRIGE